MRNPAAHELPDAVVAGSLVSAGSAGAQGAWNDWGAGSYHAGYDGVAGGSASR
ncbi:hypothetical protein [Streptomyces sp. NPDC059874]|uniref:hypothetical protein n=1 Tax=Streptomyces sp. NPDC059874 TaxID=3346983 RepID=UPI00365E3611